MFMIKIDTFCVLVKKNSAPTCVLANYCLSCKKAMRMKFEYVELF